MNDFVFDEVVKKGMRMEDEKNFVETDKRDQEIVYSKAIKAGKRIYYLDVKRNRKNEFFLAITESKKKFVGEESSQVSFEKHKIFLYKEDFEKFRNGMDEVINFINNNSENGVITSEIKKDDSDSNKRFEIDFG